MDQSNYIADLLATFKDNFTAAYRGLTFRNKSRLLPYLSCFYRRWFHSALIENTILTPANLMALSHAERREAAGNVLQMSAPVLTRKNDIRTMTFVTCEYSLERHPVIKDLEMLVDFCAPDVELDDEDIIQGSASERLRSAFFADDPFYIEYLSILAVRLGLLKKIPSIHANRAQPSADAAAFFQAPKLEIFERIVDESVTMAVSYVIGALPLGNRYPGKDFVLSLLQKPRTTDEIFDELYRGMGVNINDFFNMDDDGLDDIYNAMMSGTFYLGVIMDKYFFTVFGYYLKLINPGYVLPSDFYSELEYAIDTIQYSEDISVGMFAPCSHYSLTVLGEEFFGTTDSVDMTSRLKNMPDEALRELILGSAKAQASRLDGNLMTGVAEDTDRQVLELKCKSLSSKGYWKHVEFAHTMTLHEVYVFLAYEFGCDTNMNYAFYPDLTLNPFTAYTSPAHKRRTKKTDNTTLADFPVEPGMKFMLVMYDMINPFTPDAVPVKELTFELEFIKIKPYDLRKHYPYVTRISQSFRNFEFDDEWF